jgi:hypothetical protein
MPRAAQRTNQHIVRPGRFADGHGPFASFVHPKGIVVNGDGWTCTVVDDKRVRQIDLVSGAVTTIAGSSDRGLKDGVGEAAQFDLPVVVAVVPGDGPGAAVAKGATTRGERGRQAVGGWRLAVVECSAISGCGIR